MTPRTLARPLSRRLGLLLAAALLSACAGLPGGEAPEQAVQRLAEERLKAHIAKDYAKMYSMAAPSYRKLKTQEWYGLRRAGLPAQPVAGKVLWVKCDTEARCEVRLELEHKVTMPLAPKAPLKGAYTDVWVREDGRWWMFETL